MAGDTALTLALREPMEEEEVTKPRRIIEALLRSGADMRVAESHRNLLNACASA